MLYESYIHPLTILSTLPSAGVGALLALLAAGQDLNVIGIIAIILLIGIVKKNGIMIVDVALRLEREEHMPPREAVARGLAPAASPDPDDHRLRHAGRGAHGRSPSARARSSASRWAIAIVGGLVVSQALTLFTTPVIYIYLDRLRRKEEGEEGEGSPGAPELAPAE